MLEMPPSEEEPEDSGPRNITGSKNGKKSRIGEKIGGRLILPVLAALLIGGVGGALFVSSFGSSPEEQSLAIKIRLQPTPDVCPNEIERAYFVEMDDYILSIDDARVQLVKMLQLVVDYPVFIGDEDWLAEAFAQLVQMEVGAEALLDIYVPSIMVNINRHAKGFALDTLAAVDHIETGIRDLDIDEMDKGAASIDDSVFHIENLTQALSEFCE